MSWSLQLRNGDLFHHQGRYATVQGPAKLIQDLRLWILEHMGSDDLHPTFGSVLDGGTWPDGTTSAGVINTMDFNQAALDIEGEIRRIENEYQERQLARINSDVQVYGKSTLRRDETLEGITSITFEQVGDTLFVRLVVKPLAGGPEIIDLPVITTA